MKLNADFNQRALVRFDENDWGGLSHARRPAPDAGPYRRRGRPAQTSIVRF